MNILNREGFLTFEERKEPLEHGCNYFCFKSCVDLSEPIKVIPFGRSKEYSIQDYSSDVASFICWWTHFVHKDLNSFNGFSHVKFEPIGFKIV